MSRVVVVGGGISGLVATYRILEAQPDASVTILESRGRLGGCLKSSDLGGFAAVGADVGAEASLYVRPETAGLCRELGLPLEFPSRRHSSQIYSRGRMHGMPNGTLMGVPADPESVRGLLNDDEVDRVRNERLTPAVTGDVSVGDFLSARLGGALVDTVVDPLLGGVYSGRCRDLSLAATIPALLPAAQVGTSVLEAVARVQEAKARRTAGANVPGSQGADSPPVFMSLRGGITKLTDALAERLRELGAVFELNTAVRGVERAGGQWTVRFGGAALTADLLILAVPAPTAGELLGSVDEEAANLLRGVEYASSAVVTAVVDIAEAPLPGSGFLLPPTEDAFIKASTFASNKWPWLAEMLPSDTAVVRMSVGRFGDHPGVWAELGDEELIARSMADWRRITGRRAPLHHAEVQRWTAALPQYFPGHLERAARIDARLSGIGGLGLVGSAYEGVGIPACISRAEREVARLLDPASASAP
ncbi:protoporphyrinogen oxidase [Brevibacterium daeguense]|uniref:Coproporphyrinogen III oxidase n=1 Tax=Brevibacterium daeguense TaxID=909936 RepID=A0ABP8EMV7_9MICO